MKTAKPFLSLIVIVLSSFLTLAQETDWETDDVPELFQVEYFLFNEDMADEAKVIIEHYFSAASLLAETPAPFLELAVDSADYNYVVVWTFTEGGENLSWQTYPTNSKWYRALVEIAGSEERAKALIVEFDSCVRASKTELAQLN